MKCSLLQMETKILLFAFEKCLEGKCSTMMAFDKTESAVFMKLCRHIKSIEFNVLNNLCVINLVFLSKGENNQIYV